MTTLAAISVALLIYAAFIGLIMSKLNSMIGVTIGGPAPKPLYTNGNLNLFGWSVPIELVFIVGSLAPTLLVLQKVLTCVRRHNRKKLGQCVDCGYPLGGRRGRCPRCGLRYERSGRPAYSNLFPVLIRRSAAAPTGTPHEARRKVLR
jgi:hypothetical protein